MCQISEKLKERNRIIELEQTAWDNSHAFTVEDVRNEQIRLCWLKDSNQRMLAVSPAYERHIGIRNRDYVGELDGAHHDEGQTYQDHDELVLLQKTGLMLVEHWVNAAGEKESGVVLKVWQWDPKTKTETTYGEVLRMWPTNGTS